MSRRAMDELAADGYEPRLHDLRTRVKMAELSGASRALDERGLITLA